MKNIRNLVEEIEVLSEANAKTYSEDTLFRTAIKLGDFTAIAAMLPDTPENREHLEGFIRRMSAELKQKGVDIPAEKV